MKKLFVLFIILLFLFNYKSENINTVFFEVNNEIYDNYYIKFNNCALNTNNFIDKLSYLKDYDFKILQIVPYNTYNNNFYFYSNDLNYIHNKFVNDYINIMLKDSKYTTNICIDYIKINTSNLTLKKLKNIIDFSYIPF